MKIYVITKGEYSDYHICAVATDRGEAERLAKIYSDKWDDASVEEYDTEATVNLLGGRFPFSVYFYDRRDPHVFDEKENNDFKPGVSVFDQNRHPSGARMAVRIYAPDDLTALKSAIDKRAQYLAEKAGI